MPRIKTERDVAVDHVRAFMNFIETQSKAAVQAAYLRAFAAPSSDNTSLTNEIARLEIDVEEMREHILDRGAPTMRLAGNIASTIAYLALLDMARRNELEGSQPADGPEDPYAGVGGAE